MPSVLINFDFWIVGGQPLCSLPLASRTAVVTAAVNRPDHELYAWALDDLASQNCGFDAGFSRDVSVCHGLAEPRTDGPYLLAGDLKCNLTGGSNF